MIKSQLFLILNDIFKPYGFKKKGNNWTKNFDRISIRINLQKSAYSNVYYLNYGFNINTLPLDGFEMHIYNRLPTISVIINEKPINLLDIDSIIDNKSLRLIMKNELEIQLIEKIKNINDEHSLFVYLNGDENISLVSPAVYDYYKINRI